MTRPATRHWTTRRHLIVAAAVIVVVAWFAGQLSTALHSAAPDASALAEPTTPTVAPSAPATTVTIEAVPAGTVAADIPVPVVPTSSPADPAGTIGALDALAVLAGIPVELEHRDGYDRDLFAVWMDADGDGCDTREEVLAAENRNPVGGGCPATNGTWFSAYDNINSHDPGAFDVDHVVSLKETFDSGAWAWSPERRIAYGNDLTDDRTLVAVSAASNRAKGDRDPSNWIPDSGLCDYLGDWIAIKARWGLSMDESEHGRLGNLVQRDCPGLTIDGWPPAP